MPKRLYTERVNTLCVSVCTCVSVPVCLFVCLSVCDIDGCIHAYCVALNFDKPKFW